MPDGQDVPEPSPAQYSVVTVPDRSRTKTSCAKLTSPGTRLNDSLSNATTRPSAEIEETAEELLPSVPLESALHSSVCPVARSPKKDEERRRRPARG